jgi:uncharacterized protein YcfJ
MKNLFKDTCFVSTKSIYFAPEGLSETVDHMFGPEADKNALIGLDRVKEKYKEYKNKPLSEQLRMTGKMLKVINNTLACLEYDHKESEYLPELYRWQKRLTERANLFEYAAASEDPEIKKIYEADKPNIDNLRYENKFEQNLSAQKIFEEMSIPEGFPVETHQEVLAIFGTARNGIAALRCFQMEARQDRGAFTTKQKILVGAAATTGSALGGVIGLIGGPIGAFVGSAVGAAVGNYAGRYMARRRNQKKVGKAIQRSGDAGHSIVRAVEGSSMESYGVFCTKTLEKIYPVTTIKSVSGKWGPKDHPETKYYYDVDQFINQRYELLESRLAYMMKTSTLKNKVGDDYAKLREAYKIYKSKEGDRFEITDDDGKKRKINPYAKEFKDMFQTMLDDNPLVSAAYAAVHLDLNKKELDRRLSRDFGIDPNSPDKDKTELASACDASGYHTNPRSVATMLMAMEGLDFLYELEAFKQPGFNRDKSYAGKGERTIFKNVYTSIADYVYQHVLMGDEHPELKSLLAFHGLDVDNFEKLITDPIRDIENQEFRHTMYYGYTDSSHDFIRFRKLLKEYAPDCSALRQHKAINPKTGKSNTLLTYADTGYKQLKKDTRQSKVKVPKNTYRARQEYFVQAAEARIQKIFSDAGGADGYFQSAVNEKISDKELTTKDLRKLMGTGSLADVFEKLDLDKNLYGAFYESLRTKLQYIYPLPPKYEDADSEIANRALLKYFKEQIVLAVQRNPDAEALWPSSPDLQSTIAKVFKVDANGFLNPANLSGMRSEMNKATKKWKLEQCVRDGDRLRVSFGASSIVNATGTDADAWEIGKKQGIEQLWFDGQTNADGSVNEANTKFVIPKSGTDRFRACKQAVFTVPTPKYIKTAEKAPSTHLSLIQALRATKEFGPITHTMLYQMLQSQQMRLTIDDGNGGIIPLNENTKFNELSLLSVAIGSKVTLDNLLKPYYLDIQPNTTEDMRYAYNAIRKNKDDVRNTNLIYAYKGSGHKKSIKVGDSAYIHALNKHQIDKGLLPEGTPSGVEPATHFVSVAGFVPFDKTLTARDTNKSLYQIVHAELAKLPGCSHPRQSEKAMQNQIIKNLNVMINGAAVADDYVLKAGDIITGSEVLTTEAFGPSYIMTNPHNAMLGNRTKSKHRMSLVSVNRPKKTDKEFVVAA